MEDFKKWLQENKHITHKVSMDNASRVKRALFFLDAESISSRSLGDLELNNSFKGLSVSVKSQIRRAVKLYIEYLDNHT